MSKSFVIKALPLVLIVFSIFTISLTENLQLVDGLSAYSAELKTELEKGDMKLLEWGIVNTGDTPIDIEFYATGPGSELLVFEQYDTIAEKSVKMLEIFVQVPDDYQDNIELRPEIHALQRGSTDDVTGAAMITSLQMNSAIFILIGDNPIYTPPVIQEKEELPEAPKKEVFEPEYVEEESLEDKLARIQEANKAREVIVDDVFEESFEEEAVTDYEPEPIYELEPKDIVQPNEETIVEETPGCGFIDWLLSLFGMAKC